MSKQEVSQESCYGVLQGTLMELSPGQSEKNLTQFPSVTFELADRTLTISNVAVFGSVTHYFKRGMQARFFYLQIDDLKEKLAKKIPNSDIDQPNIYIYAMITDDGKHVFDEQYVRHQLKALNIILTSFRWYFRGGLLLSLPLMFFFLLGLIVLHLVFKWVRPSIVYFREFIRRLDVQALKKELSNHGFDLEKNVVVSTIR